MKQLRTPNGVKRLVGGWGWEGGVPPVGSKLYRRADTNPSTTEPVYTVVAHLETPKMTLIVAEDPSGVLTRVTPSMIEKLYDVLRVDDEPDT